MVKKINIITFDGTSASGKGTISKMLSDFMQYDYLDSGLLYRYLAYHFRRSFKEQNFYDNDEFFSFFINIIPLFDINDIDLELLRTEIVAELASKIAMIPRVRVLLSDYQKDKILTTQKGIVLDGRDAGTVIAPNADVKFYLDANPQVRAYRRLNQENKSMEEYDRVVSKIKNRDRSDLERSVSPLKIAKNSIFVDTTNRSIAELFDFIIYRVLSQSIIN